MKIINYGHACFKVISDNTSVLFDPYQDNSVPGLKLKNNQEVDYVFCSHAHADHNAIEKTRLTGLNKDLRVKTIELPHDTNGGSQRGMSKARIIYFSDYSICHLGDIGDPLIASRYEELKDIDIVLCPINGYFTISALEAIELQKKMNWKLLIPMHYEIKEKRIGYPDGGQIDIFKANMKNYQEIDSDEIDVDQSVFHYDSVIFLKHRG